MTPIYDTKDPRIIAAHNAGEATAKRLLNHEFKYSPEYIAMAVVQDAFCEFDRVCQLQTGLGK